MVAPGQIPPLPSHVTLSPAVQRMGWGPVTFTIDDVSRMVADGILPEDASVELLNGSLIYRDRFDLKGGEVVAGTQHDYVVTSLAELSARINNEGRHIRTQTTLVCAERHAPIPDATILRGTKRDYREGRPKAFDAFCVVEVADSSYERDTGEKLHGYALAGIVQYVVINLRNRTAEVYTPPDGSGGTYPPALVIAETGSLALRVGDSEFFTIPLADVLP